MGEASLAKLKERGRPPTISQVATAARVDRSTVSRAFSRPELLRPETVEQVKAVAAELGYVPNHSARALSTGRHGNVALIVPDVANPFFPPLIRAAQREAERLDFCVFLGNSDEGARQEEKLLERLSGQVEGILLASSRLPEERIRAHAARKPLVLINRDVSGIPRVLIDSGSGVAEAVRHLAGLGHSRIVYVSGPAASWSNRQRRASVKKSTAELGLEMLVVPAQVPSFEAGRRVVPQVLATGATGVVAFDDLIAQGILAGLRAHGLRTPTDIAVVGCDDVLGAATDPPLTTLSNRSSEAGKIAISLLLDMLNTGGVRDVRYVLETHLVVRDTTLAPPH
jgi:LacI family transcriptional regulator